MYQQRMRMACQLITQMCDIQLPRTCSGRVGRPMMQDSIKGPSFPRSRSSGRCLSATLAWHLRVATSLLQTKTCRLRVSSRSGYSKQRCRHRCMQTCWTPRPHHQQRQSLGHRSNTRSRKKTKRPTPKTRKHPTVPEADRQRRGELILNFRQPLSASSLSSAPSLPQSKSSGPTPTPLSQPSLLPSRQPLLSHLVPLSRNGVNLSSKTLTLSTSTTSFKKNKRPVSRKSARTRSPKILHCT